MKDNSLPQICADPLRSDFEKEGKVSRKSANSAEGK